MEGPRGNDPRADTFRALLEINKKINLAAPTETLLTAIAEEAARLLDVDNAGFRLVEGEELVVAGLAGTARETMTKLRIGLRESLSGQVATEGRAIIADLETVADILIPEHLAADRRLGYVSYLVVPLRVGARIIGVLNFRSRRPFSSRDQDVAEAFAGQAALALEQARLYRDSQRQAERMAALASVERLVAETLDADVVAQRIVDSVCDLLGARSSVLYRLDAETNHLVAVTLARETGFTFEWARLLPAGHGIAGLAVRERCAVLAEDSLHDARIVYAADMLPRLQQSTDRGLLAAPLVVQGRVFGALVVGDRTGRRFSAEDVHLAEAFADQAAIALDHARLFAETRRRLDETETLLSVSRALSSTLDLPTLLRDLLRRVAATLGADSVGVWLLGDDGEWLEPHSGYHLPPQYLDAVRRIRLSIVEHDFYAEAARTLRPVFSRNVEADSRVPPIIRESAPHRSQVFVPIVTQGRLIGGFGAVWWERECELSAQDLDLMEAIANQAAIAMANARLFDENRRQVDELSVLYELSRAVTGQLDRAALLDAIATQMGRVVDARHMSATLVDPARNDLEVILRIVDGVRQPVGDRYPPRGVGLQSVVLETGRPIRSDDYVADCAHYGVEPVAWSRSRRFWLGVPLTVGDETLGVVALQNPERPFTDRDERLLTNVGQVAALALRSARLFEERERAYGDLAAAQDHLVRIEKLRALGEMASGVAHDFNNVLAAILGRAQLLQRYVKDAKLSGWLQVIERSAIDGAQTVRRLQEFARVRRDEPFASVDLNEVVRDAIEMTQSRWREDALRQGVVIDVRTATAPLATVAGDAAELREAMTNLILNAVDAMPRGGILSVSTAVNGDSVQLVVSDTGVGIPAVVKNRIFDPFFTTKGPQGTGLGLSMTYGILSRHGARITVDSEEGRGSTFRITFSRAEPLMAAPTAVAAAPPPLGSLRCLVVDDEPMVAMVLGDVLEASGHQVVVLTDGAEAVARVQQEPFDVVFTDLAMPRVSGWDVAHAVKAAAPGVPVFLVTGFGVELSAAERRAHGVTEVFSKPLRIEDITRAVASVSPQSGARHAEEGQR